MISKNPVTHSTTYVLTKITYSADFIMKIILWIVIILVLSDYQLIFENGAASSEGDFVLVEDSVMRRDFQMMPAEERGILIRANSHMNKLTR